MSAGVVIGYDGSPCARRALHAAIEVARAYGETLTIAFAYDLSPVGGELTDYAAAVRELATQRIAEARELAAADEIAHGITVETAILERAPAAGLVELAAQLDARVIVVGTRGESPLRGALLGSTPHKLMHLSDRPVLVVPATD